MEDSPSPRDGWGWVRGVLVTLAIIAGLGLIGWLQVVIALALYG